MRQHIFNIGLGGVWRPGSVIMVLMVAVCLWSTQCSAQQQSDFDVAHMQTPADALFDEQLVERDQLPKAARSEAMASLLLKNLRFRELQRRLLNTEDELVNRHRHHYTPAADSSDDSYERILPAPAKRLTADDLVRVLNGKKAKDEQSYPGERLPTLRFAMRKRQSVSVSELAQMLQDKMKARNAPEDNVKLQSLRFGRR